MEMTRGANFLSEWGKNVGMCVCVWVGGLGVWSTEIGGWQARDVHKTLSMEMRRVGSGTTLASRIIRQLVEAMVFAMGGHGPCLWCLSWAGMGTHTSIERSY